MMTTKTILMITGLAMAGAVFARDTSDEGSRLKTNVDITLKALYTSDSNLFQTRDERGDEYFTALMGLDLGTKTTGMEAGIGGEIRDKTYDEYSDQNDREYDLTARAVVGGNTLKAGLYGNFRHAIAPVDSTNLARVESYTNTGWATFTVVPSDIFSVQLTGGTEDKYYKGFDALEYFKTYVILNVYHKLSDKTTLGMTYTHADLDYDDNVRYDATLTRITGYMDYAMTGKLTSHVEIGVESADYDTGNGTITDTDDASNELFLALSLNYTVTEKVDVYAGIDRQVHQSSAANSNFYTEVISKLGVVFTPTQKIRTDLCVRYSETDENNTFDSEVIGGAAKVNYAIRDWVGLEAGYEFSDRDSDSPTGDYQREIATVGVVVTW